MSAPSCIIQTKETKALAKATKVNPVVILSKIASWQAETGRTGAIPTEAELREFLKNQVTPFIPTFTLQDVYGEGKNVTIARGDVGNALASSSRDGAEDGGRLIKLPKEPVTPEKFFESIQGTKQALVLERAGISLATMAEYMQGVEDVETFLLLKELSSMSHVEEPDVKRDILYAWEQLLTLKRFSDEAFEKNITEELREVTIEFDPNGKGMQTYTIRQDSNNKWHIYNREGKEVFKLDEDPKKNKNRHLIFGQLAIKRGDAVIVKMDNNRSYIVYKKSGKIISMATGETFKAFPGTKDYTVEIKKRANAIFKGLKKEAEEEKKGLAKTSAQPAAKSTVIGENIKPSTNTSNIEFIEFKGGYAQRTDANAEWSDVTLGFAVDFNSPSEKRTAKAAGKKYIPFNLFHDGDNTYDGDEIVALIREAGLPTENIKLNITGNGIYTEGMPDQATVDELVYQAIKSMLDAGITISEIRSGGQTGVDEAGAKAAQKLGIKVSIVAPKGYMFRDANGNDVSNEQLFKARFGIDVSQEGINDTTRTSDSSSSSTVITKAKKAWTREEVAADTRTLYIFADNTDRDSGRKEIDPDSRYAKKYGKGKHYPTKTSAIIRGLDNAMPISTQRWYHEGAKMEEGRWTDEDAKEFEKVIKEEIDAIIAEWKTGKYDRIETPMSDGFFYARISAITKERTPKLFKILTIQYSRLKKAVGDTASTDSKGTPSVKKYSYTQTEQLKEAVDAATEDSSKKKAEESADTAEKSSKKSRRSRRGKEDEEEGRTINAALNALNEQASEYEVTTEGVDTSKLGDNPLAKLAREMSPLEKRDRVELLSRLFSRTLDRIVEEEREAVEEEYKEARKMIYEHPKDKNLKKRFREIAIKRSRLRNDIKGRKWCINNYYDGANIGLNAIIAEVKDTIEGFATTPAEEYDEDYGVGEGTRMVAAYQRILDNFDQLMKEACVLLEWTEGFQVVIESTAVTVGDKIQGKSLKDSGDDKTAEEKALEEEQFGDDEDGSKTASGNDGWTYKARFSDPRTTLSKQVKKLLNNLEERDYDDNPLVDDLGNQRYLRGELAHAQLLSVLSELIIEPDDFYLPDEEGYDKYPALQKIKDVYPYVIQIMDAFEENPDLIGAFYSDFNKAFISYWKEDDLGNPLPLNNTIAGDSALQEFLTNYENSRQLDKDAIYTTGGEIVKKNVNIGIKLITDLISREDEFDVENSEEDVKNLAKLLRMLGLSVSEKYLKGIFDNLVLDKEDGANDDLYKLIHSIAGILDGVKDENIFPKGSHLIDIFRKEFKTISKIVGEVSELSNIMSFRDGDKTRYSYSAPNYAINLVRRLKSEAKRESFLENEFKPFSWFMNQSTGEWLSDWLDLIDNNEIVRGNLAIKEVISRGDLPYDQWTPDLVRSILVNEYYSQGTNNKSKMQFAYYNFPIFSDSPAAMFIRMPRYVTNRDETFKEQLMPKFINLVKQELIRIKQVTERRKKMEQLVSEGKFSEAAAMEIQNFDKRGAEFCFFPELNRVEGFKKEAQRYLDAGDITSLEKLISATITTILDKLFEEYLNDVLLEEFSNDFIRKRLMADEENQELNHEHAKELLEEYFWNSTFATSQIIQLTTTDLAFYKNGVDFQKRFKEVYAAGNRLNTNVKYGRKVERTIYLKDKTITSSSFMGLRKSLEGAVEAGRLTAPQVATMLSKFKDINMADAQSFRSPESYRAVMAMMGAWTPDMERALNNFEKGTWNYVDFQIVWQTIKPFMFTNVAKDDGVGGKIRSPHQNKNSEFLVLATYQMLAAATQDSEFLVGIGDFFKAHPDIDVIQFESAVKVGGQGKINLNYSTIPTVRIEEEDADGNIQETYITRLESYIRNLNLRERVEKLVGEKDYKKLSDSDIFKIGMDHLLEQEAITQQEYNDAMDIVEPTAEEIVQILEESIQDPNTKTLNIEQGVFNHNVVHELSYVDYMIAQPTPEHLFDVDDATAGSQFRNLIIANLPEDYVMEIGGRKLTKKEIIKLYKAAITDNLLDSFADIAEDFSSIEKLQKRLLRLIRDNPKYGDDLVQALQIIEITHPVTGVTKKVFNLPPDLPSITAQIQELVTSSFKNKVTKQKIKGGNAILVANVGLTRDLNVIRDSNGRVLGAECLLPAYSKEFYGPFLVEKVDEEGNKYQELDIEKMPKELRRIIGYRI